MSDFKHRQYICNSCTQYIQTFDSMDNKCPHCGESKLDLLSEEPCIQITFAVSKDYTISKFVTIGELKNPIIFLKTIYKLANTLFKYLRYSD